MSPEMNTSALLRLSFISSLFVLNFLCLIKIVCYQRLNHCIHTTTCAFIIVASTAYLSSWLPYLFHSFYNSTVWPLLDIKDHCIIQHTVSGQITTIFFAILCVRKLYDAFEPPKARILSYAACIAWIIPQLVYLTMAEIVNVDDNNSFHFLDRVQPSNSTLPPTDSKLVTEGFMICVHKMSSAVIAQMSWHYVVLVIPMTAMLLICLAANYLKESFTDNKSNKDGYCKCSSDLILNLCLYLNFLWLLLLRPVVVLRTLLSQSNEDSTSAQWSPINPFSHQTQTIYMDFGTHLMLIIISILVPFSTHGGFRTDIKQRVRQKAVSKYCPSNAIKALESNYYDLELPKKGTDSDSVRAIKLNSALY